MRKESEVTECEETESEVREWSERVGGGREIQRRAEGLIVGLRKATKHIQHRHTHTHTHVPTHTNIGRLYSFQITMLCIKPSYSNRKTLVYSTLTRIRE